MLPKISIVTPSYNQGKFIERTIRSVLDQNYPNLEYIVIDGGSKDETVEILEKYGRKIKWVSEKDSGQTEAINKGLRMSTGDILAYLNSDDTYELGGLKLIGKYFARYKKTMIVYGNGRHIDENDKYINDYPSGAVSYEILKSTCPVCQPSVFWKRKLWEDIGSFDESLRFGMDYDYWIRVAKKYKFTFIGDYIANTRLHSNTKTLSQAENVAKELMMINKSHYGLVDDRWILDYVGQRNKNLINGSTKGRVRYLFNLICGSLLLSIRFNRKFPQRQTWCNYCVWLKELVAVCLNRKVS